MAMKSIDAPRRLYTRKARPFVNFQGTFWGPAKGAESDMDVQVPVVCEASEDGKKVTVVQKRAKKKAVTETWVPIKL